MLIRKRTPAGNKRRQAFNANSLNEAKRLGGSERLGAVKKATLNSQLANAERCFSIMQTSIQLFYIDNANL